MPKIYPQGFFFHRLPARRELQDKAGAQMLHSWWAVLALMGAAVHARLLLSELIM